MPQKTNNHKEKHQKTLKNEVEYFVTGMHCASCELLIEKKLLKEEGIVSVNASNSSNRVVIVYKGKKPTLEKLNNVFEKDGYRFSDKEEEKVEHPLIKIEKYGQILLDINKIKNLAAALAISLAFIAGFIALNKYGITSLFMVGTNSALPAFFIFGLLAGVSTCAALVGGLILSVSKHWAEKYTNQQTGLLKFQPHVLFNTGRLLSYTALGFLLGAIGSAINVSATLSSIIMFTVSIIMIVVGLQLLGVKFLQKLQVSIPKSITNYMVDESNFKSRSMPFIMGALTVFLPCGFTITTQGLAVATRNPLQGALIMFFFALGTLPSLLAIGITSTELLKKPHYSNLFSRVAGIIILFFAFFNINAQLNTLDLPSLTDLSFSNQSSEQGFVPVVSGKQILKMDALAYAYEPNYFKIKPNIPARLEIADKGTSGCTNAVISKGLFEGEVKLTPGKTSTKEFTPTKEGRYKFSCWMGMVSGIIDVTDENGSLSPVNAQNAPIPSGASGCGGNTGSCSGECGGGCGNPNCPYAR